jgi:hypothetical protein
VVKGEIASTTDVVTSAGAASFAIFARVFTQICSLVLVQRALKKYTIL